MGGVGSGNFSVWRSRRGLVEHAFALDVAALTRAGQLCLRTATEGQWCAATPLRSRRLTVWYSGDLIDPEAASVTFSFQVQGVECHQTVRLVTTIPHLGGTRLWFVCPITDQRARILYLPKGSKQFASREAHALAYRSQSEAALLRDITRVQNIRARLNGSLSIHDPLPPRPKRMHQRTYDRLRAKALTIERCVLEDLTKSVPKGSSEG